MELPIRGFGWAWTTNSELRDALGWAVAPEVGQQTMLRYDAGGIINADGDYDARPGRYTLTTMHNHVFIFDENGPSFSWEPASP